jgi:ElaA protein
MYFLFQKNQTTFTILNLLHLPTYIIKHFTNLTALEVYKILQVRNEVFILEQTCYYQDVDDRDLVSHHLLVLENDDIIGYARLLPKGIAYDDYCSIGRVLVTKPFRAHKYGKVLMQKSIEFCLANFEGYIKIGAQKYLEKFYTELGFATCGPEYLEDEIPHLPMVFAISD